MSDRGEPITILFICFIIGCLWYAGNSYLNYVDELENTIKDQNQAILLLQMENQLYRSKYSGQSDMLFPPRKQDPKSPIYY